MFANFLYKDYEVSLLQLQIFTITIVDFPYIPREPHKHLQRSWISTTDTAGTKANM